jgi:hypothetical protein
LIKCSSSEAPEQLCAFFFLVIIFAFALAFQARIISLRTRSASQLIFPPRAAFLEQAIVSRESQDGRVRNPLSGSSDEAWSQPPLKDRMQLEGILLQEMSQGSSMLQRLSLRLVEYSTPSNTGVVKDCRLQRPLAVASTFWLAETLRDESSLSRSGTRYLICEVTQKIYLSENLRYGKMYNTSVLFSRNMAGTRWSTVSLPHASYPDVCSHHNMSLVTP